MSQHATVFPEPADAVEAQLRLKQLRGHVARICNELPHLSGEGRDRANAVKRQAEREISFLRWWLRRDSYAAHQQRRAIRARQVIEPDYEAEAYAIVEAARLDVEPQSALVARIMRLVDTAAEAALETVKGSRL